MGGCAIVVLVVAANAFDEDVHPEVRAYLEARPPVVADALNGYLRIVALAGGAGDLPLPAVPQGNGDLCAMDAGTPCMREVRAEERAARERLAEHALLLQRYRQLPEYPLYREPPSPADAAARLPAYLRLIAGQKLFHIQSALRIDEGRAIQVAYDLERSLKFSRLMLAGSSTLLGKMIAAAHARRAALFVSQMLPELARADRKALARIAQALAPLTLAERSLVGAHRSELALFAAGLRFCEADKLGWHPYRLASCYFFQPNATLNRHYFTAHKLVVAMEKAPTRCFEELRAALDLSSRAVPWWSILYNPVGKLRLGAGSTPARSDHLARVQDVDALFRLVALQALIGAAGIDGEEVPQFLARNAKRYGDPYSGRAMGWDPALRQLYFEPRGTGRVKRFSAGLL